jgi:RNA polymerase primary sigma factor
LIILSKEIIMTSETIQACDRKDVVSRYFIEIAKVPLLTCDEEVDLALKIRQGNEKALNKLIRANLRFVVSIALDYKNYGLALSDLINEGNIGLIKAAKRFDPTKGFKFISYAVWWIKQAITQAIADHARSVRLPVNKINIMHQIGKTAETLEQEFEREPTLQEIANALHTSQLKISRATQFSNKNISFDAPLKEDSDCSLLELTEDTNQMHPDAALNHDSLNEKIKEILESISTKEAEILSLYFGINRERALTLEEIGQHFRLTRERVRQIKERAIQRLRYKSRSKSLKNYLS